MNASDREIGGTITRHFLPIESSEPFHFQNPWDVSSIGPNAPTDLRGFVLLQRFDGPNGPPAWHPARFDAMGYGTEWEMIAGIAMQMQPLAHRHGLHIHAVAFKHPDAPGHWVKHGFPGTQPHLVRVEE